MNHYHLHVIVGTTVHPYSFKADKYLYTNTVYTFYINNETVASFPVIHTIIYKIENVV